MRLVGKVPRRELPPDVRPVPRDAADARATELADGVWSLRLPMPYPAPVSVNCYLLELADGYCLVDCGTSLPPGWEALACALARAGVEPAGIRLLVLTHLHSDHAGAAAEVVRRTGCEVARRPGPDTCNDAIRDARAPLAERHRVALRAGVPGADLEFWTDTNLAGDGGHPAVMPDRLLAEGDEIESPAGRWRVVPTPGHSPTQLALFEPRRRWAISADLAYRASVVFYEYGSSDDPIGEHLDSLARVEALAPELLLPGHGRPLTPAVDVLERSRATTLAACARVRALLGEEPRSAYEVALDLVGDERDTNRRQEGLVLTLSVLRHLEVRGEIEAEVGPDGTGRVRVRRRSREG